MFAFARRPTEAQPVLARPECRGAGLFASPLPVALLTFALISLLGCANPGLPLPPSLHLPSPATGLVGERRGNVLYLHWNNPPNTTDGAANQPGVAAVICASRAGAAADACTEIGRATATPGPQTLDLPLDLSPGGTGPGARPGTLLGDPPVLYSVRVRLINRAGRFAPPGGTLQIAGGRAPGGITNLKASAARGSITLTWDTSGQDSTGGANAAEKTVTQVRRTLVNAPPAKKPVKSRNPFIGGSTTTAGNAANETTFRADDRGSGTRGNQSGVSDPEVRDGDTYRYTVQRVRIVNASGKTFEIPGPSSDPVTITYRATFPAKAPTGLAIVPAASSSGAPTLDLSWLLNDEPDVTGYNVYRRDAGASSFHRLNAAPVESPAYSDAGVQPGRPYIYRITAVDRAGNESASGAEASETPRK